MLPISPSAEGMNSLPASRPRIAHSASASSGVTSRSTVPCEVADDAEHDGRDLGLRVTGGVDRLGEAERAGARGR